MLSPVMANESPIRSLRGKVVLVLVQGELAQSPRMLNHARALREDGAAVVLAGDAQLPLPDDIAHAPGLSIRRKSRMWAWNGSIPCRAFSTCRWQRLARSRPRYGSLGCCWQRLGRSMRPLCKIHRPCRSCRWSLLAARARGARVIVDWHSRTAAMLGLRLGRRHAVVRLVNRLEGWLARRAADHLAVSNAMREDLRERFGFDAAVLHDRPRLKHATLNAEQRVAIVRRALSARRVASAPDDAILLVSPTSFSADEDMDMLLDALGLVARRSPARPIILFATGFGPLRPSFEARARKAATGKLRIVTGWLPEQLYRDLLRAADLGISMHRSASGVDLPMKVVDMIEAGLPAAVFDYGPCLSELVPPVLKPFMFTDADGSGLSPWRIARRTKARGPARTNDGRQRAVVERGMAARGIAADRRRRATSGERLMRALVLHTSLKSPDGSSCLTAPNASDELFIRYDGAWAEHDVHGKAISAGGKSTGSRR